MWLVSKRWIKRERSRDHGFCAVEVFSPGCTVGSELLRPPLPTFTEDTDVSGAQRARPRCINKPTKSRLPQLSLSPKNAGKISFMILGQRLLHHSKHVSHPLFSLPGSSMNLS